MSHTPEEKPVIPASLPFLILGVLSIIGAAVTYGVLQIQNASMNGPVLDILLYGGLGILVLAGVADQIQDRLQLKKSEESACTPTE